MTPPTHAPNFKKMKMLENEENFCVLQIPLTLLFKIANDKKTMLIVPWTRSLVLQGSPSSSSMAVFCSSRPR
jgi:hypothetical protein